MEISFCKMNETTTNKNIDQMSNVEEKKEEEELNVPSCYVLFFFFRSLILNASFQCKYFK